MSSLERGLICILHFDNNRETIFALCRRLSSVLHRQSIRRSGTSSSIHCLSTLFRRSSESRTWPSGRSTSGALGACFWWAGDSVPVTHIQKASCLSDVPWLLRQSKIAATACPVLLESGALSLLPSPSYCLYGWVLAYPWKGRRN